MTGNDIFLLIMKTIFCYFFLFGVLRLMGKREVGEISTFDMVVFLVISELFSLSLNQPESSLLHSVVPIVIIVVLQILTAFLSLKYKKVRRVMEGKPAYLIVNGEINQEELKKNRYNLDDLMMQLRQKDIQSPEDVAFAVLEGNGTLSIVEKNLQTVAYPEPVIEDGKVNYDCLNFLKLSKEDLFHELVKNGFSSIDQIYFAEIKLDMTFRFVEKEGFVNINSIKNNIDKTGNQSGNTNCEDSQVSCKDNKQDDSNNT